MGIIEMTEFGYSRGKRILMAKRIMGRSFHFGIDIAKV